jgi:hypothetical protein
MTKSATKYLKFRGKIAWAKLQEPDDYKGEKKWKMNFYPSDETLVKMKLAGLQNKVKEDDGAKSGVSGKFVSLKRDTEKSFNGVVQKFDPPELFDAQGNLIEESLLIGNGSEVEVELAVYQTQRFGAGSRIQRVRIIDLIEYVPPEEVSENEVDTVIEAAMNAASETEERTADTSAKKPKKVKW